MEVTIKPWEGGKFDVMVASKEGAEPFLTIKSCRIVSGKNGDFVSYPATKNEKTGKYWNHVYCNDKFNAVVLSKAHEAMKPVGSGFDNMDSDIPF
jgi:DNA-binding cell septation regulator SpoVG